MSVTPYFPILSALKNQHTFTLSEDNHVTPCSSKDLTRFSKIGAYLARCLKEEPRLSPEEALEHLSLKTTSLFLKTVPASLSDVSITECKKEKKALSLGLPAEILDLPQNKGFARFTEKPPLERYLAFYQDTLAVDENQNILIRHNGTMTRWEEIRDQLQPPIPLPIQYQPWTYGPKGAQEKNLFIWTQLEPHRITPIDPNEPPSYAMRICACVGKTPRYGGDHSWIELIAAENGEKKEYSVGLYSSYGVRSSKRADKPLRLRPGYLQSPDCSRWFPDEIYEIKRPLSKAQFEKMVSKLEEDKENEKHGIHIPIQLMGDNCTRYAISIAELGSEMPSVQECFLSLLNKRHGHPQLENRIVQLLNAIPRPLASLVKIYTASICNGALVLYGAGMQEEKVKKSTPFFKNAKDIFNPNQMFTDHPWGVRRVAIEEAKQGEEREGAPSPIFL